MQKSCRYFLVCVIAAGLFACVREPHEASSGSSPQRSSRLSVDEARAFFEKNLSSDVTRASDAVPTGPFVVENVLPDWEGAEQSSNKHIACVDVPAQTGSEFLIKRRRTDGTFYGVRAYGKLLVVKSMQTDSLSTYMRYLVPDEIYATFYDGDLSNLFANCEDRGDYCGLELYTTLDGAVVAAARYYEGTLLASVFICDTRMSEFERSWRLRNLLAGVYINRRIVGPTRMTDDWDFGGKTCFYDSRGTLYYVDYIDGVGYATVDVDGTRGPCIDGIEDVNHLGGAVFPAVEIMMPATPVMLEEPEKLEILGAVPEGQVGLSMAIPPLRGIRVRIFRWEETTNRISVVLICCRDWSIRCQIRNHSSICAVLSAGNIRVSALRRSIVKTWRPWRVIILLRRVLCITKLRDLRNFPNS